MGSRQSMLAPVGKSENVVFKKKDRHEKDRYDESRKKDINGRRRV